MRRSMFSNVIAVIGIPRSKFAFEPVEQVLVG
jgi:hypothetical protein